MNSTSDSKISIETKFSFMSGFSIKHVLSLSGDVNVLFASNEMVLVKTPRMFRLFNRSIFALKE
jgi:hypothetical protein